MNTSQRMAFILVLLAPSVASAQVPAALRTAIETRGAAVTKADSATWDRLTAENFTLIVASGRVLTKAERLAQLKQQQPTTATPREHETVQVGGNLAVQRFKSGNSWVEEVWAKDRRGWRVNSVQITAIEPDSATVRRALEENNGRYTAALRSGDAAALAATYTNDAVVMGPNLPAWEGADAIRQGFAAFLGQFTVPEVKLATRDVVVSGNHVIERGHYEWTLHPKSGTGADMKDNGKYLTVWERQSDGSWKITRDMYNSDRPSAM